MRENKSKPTGRGDTTIREPQYVFAVSDLLISQPRQSEVDALAKLLILAQWLSGMLLLLTRERLICVNCISVPNCRDTYNYEAT